MRGLGVIILAAGQGKRMRSATPKVLHLLGGKPLLRHVLEACTTLEPDRMLVVAGHGVERIREAFPAMEAGAWVLQREQLGTGHAARCAADALGDFTGDVLILNGDVPLLSRRSLWEMVAAHRSGSRELTLAVATLADPSGYGRILRDTDSNIVGVVEERDAGEAERAVREINVGLYLASSDFLRAALAALDNRNHQGEYYLPDIAGFAAGRQAGIGSVTIDDPREFRGVNNREELAWME